MLTDYSGDASEVALLLCPFCGGKAKLRRPGAGAFYVKCKCGVSTRYKETEGKAIAAWNRRTPELSKESNVDWDAVMSAHQVRGECEYKPGLLFMECPHYGCDFSGHWQCYRPDGRECPKEDSE